MGIRKYDEYKIQVKKLNLRRRAPLIQIWFEWFSSKLYFSTRRGVPYFLQQHRKVRKAVSVFYLFFLWTAGKLRPYEETYFHSVSQGIHWLHCYIHNTMWEGKAIPQKELSSKFCFSLYIQMHREELISLSISPWDFLSSDHPSKWQLKTKLSLE